MKCHVHVCGFWLLLLDFSQIFIEESAVDSDKISFHWYWSLGKCKPNMVTVSYPFCPDSEQIAPKGNFSAPYLSACYFFLLPSAMLCPWHPGCMTQFLFHHCVSDSPEIQLMILLGIFEIQLFLSICNTWSLLYLWGDNLLLLLWQPFPFISSESESVVHCSDIPKTLCATEYLLFEYRSTEKYLLKWLCFTFSVFRVMFFASPHFVPAFTCVYFAAWKAVHSSHDVSEHKIDIKSLNSTNSLCIFWHDSVMLRGLDCYSSFVSKLNNWKWLFYHLLLWTLN